MALQTFIIVSHVSSNGPGTYAIASGLFWVRTEWEGRNRLHFALVRLDSSPPFSPLIPLSAFWGYHRQGYCQAGISATITPVREFTRCLVVSRFISLTARDQGRMFCHLVSWSVSSREKMFSVGRIFRHSELLEFLIECFYNNVKVIRRVTFTKIMWTLTGIQFFPKKWFQCHVEVLGKRAIVLNRIAVISLIAPTVFFFLSADMI
jgi:hypothetical protein